MKEDDVVEQTESNEDIDQVDELNKEAREYSQEYITELISAAKEYLPKTVWDHIHRRAVPKAGGKASGKSKRNARDTAAQEAASTATPTVIPEVEAQLAEAQTQQTQKADDPCEVAKQKCESMKAKAAKSAEKEVTKSDVDIEPFVGSRSKLTFVAASPGIIESVRKAALVGPTGRLFNSEYLEPLGLTRDDVAILYLVPNVLKSEDGRVREPTADEIDEWAPWFSDQWNRVIDKASRDYKLAPYQRSDAPSVALGHTVKKSLSKLIDITLPHPNSLGTKRTNQELVRKMEQLKRMLTARETGHS
jgi:hypothetical protein